MHINAKTIPLGVIGHPIAHSISPEIHNFIIDSMELNYFYCAFPVEPDSISEALTGIKALGIGGINVTIPHKEAVFKLCDSVDSFAQKIGAVNTVVNSDGILKGYNTDAPGFIRNLKRSNVDVKGKRCVILGAGGAAKGVGTALLNEGASELRIINRTREKAEKMAEELNRCFPGKAAASDSAENAQVLVNTTSVGMKTDLSPFDNFSELDKSCVVCDIVYCPRDTAFIKKASSLGYKTVGGIGMLIYQAVIAFELFTGLKVKEETVQSLFKRLEMKKNIVLTGFMGCGKSAVGRELAQMCGSELIDCDDYIEKKAGKPISKIFEEVGENGFRDLESKCIEELSRKNGVVISLGGGAVLRKENIDCLRKNGLVFRIKADVAKILRNTAGDKSRPLLNGKTPFEVEKMLRSREPFYKNCDFTVDVSHMYPNQTAHKIMDIITYKI